MLVVALFTTAKIWKQPKCRSVDKWITKREISPLAPAWTEGLQAEKLGKRKAPVPGRTHPPAPVSGLEGVLLSEVTQTERRNPTGFHLYVEYKEKK